MADTAEDDRPPNGVTLTDRRRPGRVDYQDAQLIALLRGQPIDPNPVTAEVEAVPNGRRTDDLCASPWNSNRSADWGRDVGSNMRRLVFHAVSPPTVSASEAR